MDHEVTPVTLDFDNVVIDRLNRGWELVHDQFFEKTKNASIEFGSGMSIFRFYSTVKEDGSNCEYLYTLEGSTLWKLLLGFSPDEKAVLQRYDPSTMLLWCLQVPKNDNEDVVGNFRLFDNETGELIPIEEKGTVECETQVSPDMYCLHRRKTT